MLGLGVRQHHVVHGGTDREAETEADDATKERLITTMPARVTAPESNRNEEDLASREFTCNIFPNTAKELFHRLVSA